MKLYHLSEPSVINFLVTYNLMSPFLVSVRDLLTDLCFHFTDTLSTSSVLMSFLSLNHPP